MKKGKLIVIDGIDGAGKTTQIELLDSQGVPWEAISFPQYGKNKYAESIKKYLLGKWESSKKVDPYEISKLYASDRLAAKQNIRKWLKDGKLVIANRYVSSNKAYMGAKLPQVERKKFLKWLDDLEYKKNGIPKEDLTILLVVDPKVGQKNVSSKHNPDIHERNLKHLIQANKIYLELARKEKNWVVINCMNDGKMKTKEDIQKNIVKVIYSMVLS